MDIIMDIKGYLFMICKDIFFHARYSSVYPLYPLCPAISSQISFILSVYILHFILTYPIISCFFILIFVLIYPHLIQPFYPFVFCYLSLFILKFILLVIRSSSRLIRLVLVCCLIGPSFACPSQEQGKPLCFYFPAPRCGHRWLLLLAAPATTGAGAVAATDPEPAPPTTGAGCSRIWGRGNKNTVAYHVAEQNVQKRVRLGSTPRRAGSAENLIE